MAKNKKPSYLLINDINNRPYIDELRRAYAFGSWDAAEEFAENVGKAHVKKFPEGINKRGLSECYAGGAEVLIERMGSSETSHRLQEPNILRRHYNSDLNADESRYIRTKRLDYIRSMRSCRFLVPVKIRNHPEMSVIYATVTIPTMPEIGFKYLAFSDLDEFVKWPGSARGWAPLEVRLEGLMRIGKKHGFLLDPCGAKILLSSGMLHEIAAGESEKNNAGKNT